MALTQLRNLGILANAGITTTKLGTGAVLQVVQTSTTTTTSITSTSFVDITNMSLAITPSSSNNKILFVANCAYGSPEYNASGDDFYIAIARDIGSAGYNRIGGGGSVESNSFLHGSAGAIAGTTYNDLQWILQNGTIHYLDSPATTSATTYKLQQRNRNASKQTYFNRRGGDSMSGVSYLTLMEIAG